ncbi:hypothetical protein NHX12_020263 [Muraenolepis orangiensis]|uniref:PCNA-interacting partner n=1 Tax=Muraenolepis orangiensis TaxID=630683 RepID=A0A9Q0ER53_9TELE|nr:hypothetical protein NHX12_020263 [Muraenolepis orangiensis]
MDVEGRLRTMTDFFRRECFRVLQSERVTVHGADSMLLALQLAMAQVNKQDTGEFEVALSEVMVVWRYLLLDKLGLLPRDNLIEPENYALILKGYESFLKRSNTVDLVDVHSLCHRLRGEPATTTTTAESLTPVQMFEFLSGKVDDPPPTEPSVPSTPSGKRGPSSPQIKTEVRLVFLSYLDLLVNSKNDLALARVLDIPSRALGRTAFTELKRSACAANTSLFLAATSFVRAIQLGGKGYAPAESHPLRKHVKGLAALVKGRSGEDPVCAAATETAHHLKERVGQLHRRLQGGDGTATGTGISPARPRAHVINHATALGGRDTVKVLLALLDREASAPPCRNKAHLLAEGPLTSLAGDQGAAVLTLFRSPEAAVGDSPEPLKKRVKIQQDLLKPKVRAGALRSQFSCTYRDHEDPPLIRVLDFPSGSQVPTCVHPAPKAFGSAPTATHPAAGDACVRTLVPQPAAAVAPLKPRRGPNHQESHAGVTGGGGGGGGGLKRPTATPTTTATSQNNKGSKRKQAGTENQPPAKRPSTSAAVPVKTLAKSGAPKGQSKKKLLAGQGKLTSFFRV